jgi:hypothetical protein
MLTWVTLSALSGWMILKTGYRPLIITGMTFFTGGFVLLSRLGADSGYPAVWLAMGVLGVGMGLTMVTLLLGVQNSVPRKLIATATSTMLFFRTIGGTIGVAFMGAVLTHHLTVASAATNDPSLVALASRPDAIVQASTRAGLSPQATEWLRHALAAGLDGVFLAGLFIGVAAFGVALFFPRGSARELAARREGPL